MYYASSLQECLQLQLKENGQFNNEYMVVLDNLNEIVQENLIKVCKTNKLNLKCGGEMMQYIGNLSPKPGLKFAPSLPI